MSRELFGGAISMYIPPSFEDVSNVRDVPDNQEVFADLNTDQSIIVEILQFVHQASNEDAARYHFESVANDNDAEDYSTIHQITQLTPQEVPSLPPDTQMYFCTGKQSVAKFNETDPDAPKSSSRQTSQVENVQIGF
ncbi:12529_t:CDS:2, partial [Funneliformis mosseae]